MKNVSNQTSKIFLNRKKLLGIELGRGLATFAVIVAHSGDEAWGLHINNAAIILRSFFYFAVPFFLAAAFYFMTAKSEIAYSSKFWRSRATRILIPYGIWSAIFLISRVAIFTLSNKSDRLHQLLQDPVSVIFLGGASYQLYFLPLLCIGTTLIVLMPWIEKLELRMPVLFFLSLLSMFVYYLLEISGNSFRLGSYVAFQELLTALQIDITSQPFFRVLLVWAAWIIRCSPYFFTALLLNNLPKRWKLSLFNLHPVVWMVLFLLIDVKLKTVLPGVVADLLLAFTLLLFGISVSSFIDSSYREDETVLTKSVASVGACSFGIYLCHPFLMNLTKFVLGKTMPTLTASVSVSSMLMLSVVCFLLSWLAVETLFRHRLLSKYLFGA